MNKKLLVGDIFIDIIIGFKITRNAILLKVYKINHLIVCYMLNEEVKSNVFLPKWITIQLPMASVL